MSHTLSGLVRRAVAVVGSGLLIAASPAVAQAPGTLAFLDVNVVPMDSERVLTRHTVVVQGDRIVAVDPADEAAVPPGAQRIEARGRYLLPGLIDAHATLLSGTVIAAEHAADELAMLLAHGITAVRVAAGDGFLLQLRADRDDADGTVPRLYVSSPEIRFADDGAGGAGRVATAFEAAAAVRRFRDQGYDFLALSHDVQADVYQGIVLTTRGSRLPLVGPVPPAVSLQRALEAGQHIVGLDGFPEALTDPGSPAARSLSGAGIYAAEAWSSLQQLDEGRLDDVARSAADAETWNIPLLAAMAAQLGIGPPGLDEARAEMAVVLPPRLRAAGEAAETPVVPATPRQRQRYVELRDHIVRALHDAGAKLLAGSGARSLPPYGLGLHLEIAALERAGLPPYAALRAATSAPAAFLGHRGRGRAEYAIADEDGIRFAPAATSTVDFGRIEVGMSADLVLLRANPLDEVAATRLVEGVMLSGRWFDRDRLDELRDAAARRLAGGRVAPPRR